MSKIELKDFADFVGIELTDDSTMDTVKTAFNEKYVPAEKYSTGLGELNGKVSHSIGKAAKELGIELTKDDTKDKPLHELPLILAAKLKGRMDELAGDKSATQEEIENKYKGQLTTFEQKVKDLSELNQSLSTQFEGYKVEVETKERNGKINSVKSEALGKLPWSQTATPILKKGFEATIAEKFKFDLDGDAPVVRDSAGNIVQSKAKAGAPASYEEVISMEFEASGLKAAADNKKVSTFGANPVPVQTPQNGQPAHIGWTKPAR